MSPMFKSNPQISILMVSIIFCVSCGQSTFDEPELEYESAIEASDVPVLSEYFVELGSLKGLDVLQKDEREMRAVSKGKNAFFIALYDESLTRVILTATNAGTPEHLTVMYFSFPEYDMNYINLFADEVFRQLESDFGITLKKVDRKEGR